MDDKVNSIIDGINGKNGQLVLLALALIGFGFLLYTFINHFFDLSKEQNASYLKEVDETQASIQKLNESINQLILRIEQTHK